MKSHAFTLVELLVVIVILAILVGLAFPVFREARTRGDRAAALSQMRQIGIGIAGYPADHNGSLPGPLWPGQMPQHNPGAIANNPGRLVSKLAPYLGINESQTEIIPVFVPPAYRREMGETFLQNARTYVMNMAVPMAGASSIAPFGNLATPNDLENAQPRHASQVPGNAWALSDADQLHPRVATAPWAGSTPPEIIHGTRRLALFFNGSADLIDHSALEIPPALPLP